MKMFSLFSALLFIAMGSAAQAPQTEDDAAAYTRTLNQRTAKIVATLEIPDSSTSQKVQAMIVQQYRDLNAVHDAEKDEAKKESQLKQLHGSYLSKLSTLLNQQQVDKVKDGMTYNVFHVTYTAYQDMIPTLTENQKNKIYEWLKEAREQAMDQGSSNDKHKVFGKYKGRINNYLSTEGYDLKKEEKAWQERLRKKREENKG
jgi:hypothetical protein